MVKVTHQLPYELWDQIIRQLPGQDRRRCLSISRIVHDVAIPLIFSRIVVFFGSWDSVNDPVQLAYRDADSRDDDENDNGQVAPQQHNSIELLRYIAHDPHFAEVVKKMTVAAFSSANAQEEEEGSKCLADALPHLRNLSSFAYYGSTPPFSLKMLRGLALGCGSSLHELRIPCTTTVWKTHDIKPFRELKSLVIGTPSPVDFSSKAARIRYRATQAFANYLDVHGAARPTNLSVPSLNWISRGSFLSSCSDLQEIELTSPFEGAALGFEWVLTSCPQLRSFIILRIPAGIRNSEVTTLCKHSAALPLLTSFKMSATDYTPLHDYSAFLFEKKHLRRLDLMIRDNIIHTIRSVSLHLPSVEVLGIDLSRLLWSQIHHLLFVQHLPPKLSALLVRGVQIGAVSAEEWATLFRTQSSLRYLHLLHTDYQSRYNSGPMLETLLLEQPPPSLELLGIGSRMRWVRPPRAEYSSHYDHQELWPASAVWFRSASDFGTGNEDWEWLLRHHDDALYDRAQTSCHKTYR
ncbi:hypothetical protein C8Q74DRAFT_1373760 [Fomes fomentarius]|nr:hypothetical protein C8Q74DRAFT_1373760 [Fomes fomentarius]